MGNDSIMAINNGFILDQSCFPDHPEYKGDFAIFTDDPDVVVDHCWFRGGWFDSRTVLWKNIEALTPASNPVTKGAQRELPFRSLQTKTQRYKRQSEFTWHGMFRIPICAYWMVS